MLISTNVRPAVAPTTLARPKAASDTFAYLGPGDVYVPSEPNIVSVGASGTALGMLLGGGAAALSSNLFNGFGGVGLAIGLVVAGGIAGGFGATKAFEASQK